MDCLLWRSSLLRRGRGGLVDDSTTLKYRNWWVAFLNAMIIYILGKQTSWLSSGERNLSKLPKMPFFFFPPDIFGSLQQKATFISV